MRALGLAALLVVWFAVGLATASGQTADDLAKARLEAGQFFKDRKYAKALAAQRTVAAGTEKLETASESTPGRQTAEALGMMAWYALFARAPSTALKASERAHGIAPDNLAIETNRAHALLFLGRTGEASRLYLAHKGKRIAEITDKTWDDTILEDFDAFQAAGITHTAFSRIIAALGVRRPELNAKIEATRKKVVKLYGDGKYEEAVAASEVLVALMRSRYGETRTEFAGALSWVAFSKARLQQWAEAEALHKRSLAIYERALGLEHWDVATALDNLADLYKSHGRGGEAEPLVERSLAIREKILGPEHPDVVVTLDDLAELQQAQGHGAEAEPLLRRILTIREKQLGPDDPAVAVALGKLATLYRGEKRYAEAAPLLQRVVAIREKASPNDAEVVPVLNDLADVHRAQGHDADAEPLLKRVVAIREKEVEPEHWQLIAALDNLAVLYQRQGRHAEAEQLLKRIIAIDEKTRGPEHTQLATSLSNLAGLYQEQVRYADAEPLFERSLAIREKALGPVHAQVAVSLSELGALYVSQGRYADAEPLLKRSLAIRETAFGPEHAQVALSLSNLGALYANQGRYADAEPLLKRSLAIREKALGPGHLDVASTLGSLANVYQSQGRLAEAEPLIKRELAISEEVLGRDHPIVATSLENLGILYRNQGRYPEAEPVYQRSLAIRERALGPEHPQVAASLYGLASLYLNQGRYRDAEPLYLRSIATLEKALGPQHLQVALTIIGLADLYGDQGRYGEAEPLLKRSLAIYEKELGPDHPDVANPLDGLAGLYEALGRYEEAEPLRRRSIDIREKALGPGHPNVATSLHQLAALYRNQGRHGEAEPLLKRSLAIFEAALGREHPFVGTTLASLAYMYTELSRYAEAEPLFERSLAIREQALGRDHPDVATLLYSLGAQYREQGRYADAEPLLKRSVVIYETALGAGHSNVARPLGHLGLLYLYQGRFAEAEQLLERSLAIVEAALGRQHPEASALLTNLAEVAYERSDWARAADYWRRSTEIIEGRARFGRTGAESSSKGEAQRWSDDFVGLIKATHRLVLEGRASDAAAAETFETAQWPQASEAAASLAQMAARSATGSPELAALVRERQDLAGAWQLKEKRLIAAKSEEPAKRSPEAERVLADDIAAIDRRLGTIDTRLEKEFPDYAALARTTPASVAEAQDQLGADEALVLFLDTDEWKPRGPKSKAPNPATTPEETFIWVVTKSQVRWVRSELGKAALKREVEALRCGLDAASWAGDAGVEPCAKALGIALPVRAIPDPLPFDHARAHALYKALFGQVEDLIAGKHLLIVPSGALTQLPFQVLVTDTTATSVAWLARSHAITMLPAVSSLKALRRVGRPSEASRALIGFGNPLLDGPDVRYAGLAKLAREKKSCVVPSKPVEPAQMAALVEARGGVARMKTRGGLADLAQIRAAPPLPETADELCAVAADLKVDAADIHLGARATESEIKRLSGSGELRKYRMLHFATHGATAGELDGTSEPGLFLTPPATASETDDAYLSASEIAALELDADWVVLSACNTAAGAASNAEALSGLARAFIYAGARALLVSHWEVDSDAAVKLITTAVHELASAPRMGRAEAMRRAMLALIDGGGAGAHPAYWAPFVVVGEGGAVQR